MEEYDHDEFHHDDHAFFDEHFDEHFEEHSADHDLDVGGEAAQDVYAHEDSQPGAEGGKSVFSKIRNLSLNRLLYVGAIACVALAVVALLVSGYGIYSAMGVRSSVNSNSEVVPTVVDFSKVLEELEREIKSSLGAITDAQKSIESTIFSNNLDALLAMLATGKDQVSPALSCHSILKSLTRAPSGYYWVTASNGSAVRVYCDMTLSCGGITGGWTRMVNLDYNSLTKPSCPDGFMARNNRGIHTCSTTSTSSGCTSVKFRSLGMSYGQCMWYGDWLSVWGSEGLWNT